MFPEPALLISSEDKSRRQLYLHHYAMIREALLYRLGDPDDPHQLLSTQEWRDVLGGKVHQQGQGHTKAQ